MSIIPIVAPQVFIIESPAPLDILNGRTEGEALDRALALAEIDHSFFRVVDTKAFDECVNRMVKQTKLNPSIGQFPMVYIHLSMHGNQSEVCLTSGERLTWNELAGKLTDYSGRAGLIVDNVCMQTVCFSSCNGLFGAKMAEKRKPAPYFSIVGSRKSISWQDALTAFVTFYHNASKEHVLLGESVLRMNVAIGEDGLFEIKTCSDVDALKASFGPTSS